MPVTIGTGQLRKDAATEERLRRVARSAKPPNEYGETLWDPTTKTVWWNGGRTCSTTDLMKAHRLFAGLPEVNNVMCSVANHLPRGENWTVIQEGELHAYEPDVTGLCKCCGHDAPEGDEPLAKSTHKFAGSMGGVCEICGAAYHDGDHFGSNGEGKADKSVEQTKPHPYEPSGEGPNGTCTICGLPEEAEAHNAQTAKPGQKPGLPEGSGQK